MIDAGIQPALPVLVVGPRGSEAAAGSFGLVATRSLCLPLGSPLLGRRPLRNAVGGADRIVCWSDRLATTAVGMADIVDLVSVSPEACRVPARRLASVTVFTEHDAAAWRQRGARPVLLPLPTPTVRPDRPAARNLLGVDPTPIVIAPLDDRPHAAGSRAAASLATLLHETGYPVALVCPSQSACLTAAQRHHAAIGKVYPLVVTERPLGEWLAAVDLAVLQSGDGTGSDATVQSMAESVGAAVIRMGVRGRASIGRTPAAAASVMASLDERIARRVAAEETHALGAATIVHA
ncbi:MAG: hypothetical protein D6692_02985 [Planctomycetota bacterium]|nr:MAG: hypothetical protein D6692_02985 [Planctomycetota bacterium]